MLCVSIYNGWVFFLWTFQINRSDMDMVTLPSGDTYVVWGSGNQGAGSAGNRDMGMSVAGIVHGTEQEWVESFFA